MLSIHRRKPKWTTGRESNSRVDALQASSLPSCRPVEVVVGAAGVEPALVRLKGGDSSH
jgi:hypothetical protein